MPDDSIPGPTPTGYQRTQGGGVKWVPPTAEHLSKLLPQYEIECILGYGGMGAVYKGKQKSLDRTVAIKILPPGLEDEDFSYVDRFKNEAKVMAKFMHPAIVGVFDFGETSEGQLYIVMEFVDGTDVQKMLSAQGRLPSEHALAVAAHVCDALKYAHEHGVIHRDIKPANILINMEGAVKVADFGLAKAEEHGSSGITKTGMAMGTPDYVAPEALVMGVNVDGRADLYAVGVMLYAMLTGNVPRGAFKPVAVMLPGTDPRFDKIVQKAMQMDREERYQTAAEIRRDLDVILTTPLVQAGGVSSAAIPKQSLPQKPVAKGPQKPMGKSANVPVRSSSPPAPDHALASAATKKSKTPLLIGIAAVAAIAVGAFVFSSSRREEAQEPSAAAKPNQSLVTSAATGAPSAPIKVREESKAPPPSQSAAPAPKPTVGDDVRSLTSKAGAPGAEPMKSGETKAAEPAKPASPAASAPGQQRLVTSSPTAPQFPPGQWVKVFTKFEELPFYSRSMMVFRDGWLECTKKDATPIFIVRGGKVRNAGIRVRMRVSSTIDDSFGCMLSVRGQPTPKGDGAEYRLNLQAMTTDPHVVIHYFDRAANKPEPLIANLPVGSQLTGTEHVMEMFAVGERLVGRFDGTLLPPITNSRLWDGELAFQSKHPIRDIEVINLDGIPEAEALRIIGVDEKGNDTRTSAAQPAAPMAAVSPSPSLPVSPSSPPSIPELATLDEQFKKLTAERVNAPFAADVAKLNSGYLGGLDRKMAEEKAAGHLDSVLAIEAEKKFIQGAGVANSRALGGTWQVPLPEDDTTSTTTPTALKGLRQIYRDAYAKIEANRAANLKTLTDPLTSRLKLLESDLTKKDRIADAKTVKEYREGLQGVTASSRQPSDSRRLEAVAPSTTPTALKDGFTNSLGMKFVPVKDTDVLFCIHETRYKDYAAYAAEAQDVDGSWKDQTIDGYMPTENKENHPAMNIRWEDAHAFCAWLSKKEGKTYRLPTDEEWSFAVGLGDKEKRPKGATPAMLNEKENTEFPWGGSFPPKTKDKAENYSDASRKAKVPTSGTQYIEDYDDGFPTTAPVMSFKPNKFGLYDMGGNVSEWCEDWFDAAQKDRVQRGVGWGTSTPNFLLSSHRYNRTPNFRGNGSGFRIVVETRSPSPATTKPGATTPTPPVVPPPAPATAAKSDFTNSLGMKFVKVPGAQVLFCIHETRRQDYAAYAAEVPGVNGDWKNQQKDGIPVGDKDDHPVVSVNWDDANAFSAWLSKKEGRKYRLPTDKEWSYAVGIGRDEKWTKDTTPEMLAGKVQNEFPWGGDYPPKTKDQAGNYGDTTWREIFPTQPFVEAYTDGFATSAPVMSFKPNKLGLYDLGGNVWEWVEAWWNAKQMDRVVRGSSFPTAISSAMLSSYRLFQPPAYRSNLYGFRIVVEMTAP